MPFLGQDWRSPGWSWIKTEDGWKRRESWAQDLEREGEHDVGPSIILNSEDEEIFDNEEHGCASKKRKKDHVRHDTDTQCFYREKWIYVHKESTKERHGYCTLGEAFTRLDFSSAVQDVRRFSYVVRRPQAPREGYAVKPHTLFKCSPLPLFLILSTQFGGVEHTHTTVAVCTTCRTSHHPKLTHTHSAPAPARLSGSDISGSLTRGGSHRVCPSVTGLFHSAQCPQGHLCCCVGGLSFRAALSSAPPCGLPRALLCAWTPPFQQRVTVHSCTFVIPVLSDQQNPRLIKDLLQDLSSTLCILTRGVGKFMLVGNINAWVCRLETVLAWQQQLQSLEMTQQVNHGLTLSDLPLHMLNNILYRFSDGWDIITLGQVTPTLYTLSEDRQLWKKLCQYHFAEKQFCRHLVLSESGHVDWKLMYFVLRKHYPAREQYGDTLHFCRHCSILFWKDSGHPCTAADPDSCFMPVSPQHFIDLFKF
ncbi:F-box only protein 25 [Pteropus vampyrus]|uniref:F-box only protein 25 n=1 Tax=Pteropus vampyrus TaxID=132908 RepID=A0A6P6BT14_PTEVA|nr:F-box only protein 25 [Pteropus vampyrus]